MIEQTALYQKKQLNSNNSKIELRCFSYTVYWFQLHRSFPRQFVPNPSPEANSTDVENWSLLSHTYIRARWFFCWGFCLQKSDHRATPSVNALCIYYYHHNGHDYYLLLIEGTRCLPFSSCRCLLPFLLPCNNPKSFCFLGWGAIIYHCLFNIEWCFFVVFLTDWVGFQV